MKLNLDYIAGFFDGEGCVAADRRRGVTLFITNTNYEILLVIQEFFGGKGQIHQKQDHVKRNMPCYYWQVWSRDAETILRDLTPLLRVKRTQAELALEYMALIQRRLPGERRGPRVVAPEIWAKREALADEISRLKRAPA